MENKNIPVYNIGNFHFPNTEKDFYANRASTHIKKFKSVFYPHRHNHFLTLICTKGHGIHEIDFVRYKVKPGSIFMVAPGRTHKFTLSHDADGYVIMHTRDFYDLNYSNRKVREFPFFCANLNTPKIDVNGDDYVHIKKLFEDILKESKNEQPMESWVLCSLVDVLYIKLSRLYTREEKELEAPPQHCLIQLMKLEDLIDKNYKEIKSPSKYAEMMNLTNQHLNRICKISIDKTTSDLIMDKIILEAKRMLVYAALSVDQVANELGYFDQSHFTRLFKKRTGLTPANFVKEYQRKNAF